MTDDGEPFWPEASEAHRLAKVTNICIGLTRSQSEPVKARILEVGGERFAPYRCIRNAGGMISVNLALADGTVVHLGEFHVSELDEPL